MIKGNLSRRWRDSRSSAILDHASGVTASYLDHSHAPQFKRIGYFSLLYTLHSTLLPAIFATSPNHNCYSCGNEDRGQQIPYRQLPYSQYVQTYGENEKPAGGVHLGYNRLR